MNAAITSAASKIALAFKCVILTALLIIGGLAYTAHYAGSVQITLPIGGSPIFVADALPNFDMQTLPDAKPAHKPAHAARASADGIGLDAGATPQLPQHKPAIPQSR